MARNRKGVTRREFLRDTALASGVLTVGGIAPTLALAGQVGEPKLGATLIGKLEGPEYILDPANWPKKFGEAPMLADLVKQGKLPPVDQRVPEEPMVIKPVHSIGRYGGTWRRGFTGPGDGENGNRIVSTDKILFWDYTGTKIVPCVARDVKMSEDGRVIAVLLR
ncbi:MAG: Twin-arginine translocation pathway signal, partial [candidate division NC10 bacterium]|nr:Twin-arginine translocation pathway signal [candidate division NC10 bacterium]